LRYADGFQRVPSHNVIGMLEAWLQAKDDCGRQGKKLSPLIDGFPWDAASAQAADEKGSPHDAYKCG